jgi:hypothetical protein
MENYRFVAREALRELTARLFPVERTPLGRSVSHMEVRE